MKKPTMRIRLQAGFSLIELLVAMGIGLIVTLAITSTLTLGESHKRTTTSTNDMNQSGNYAAYVLDRAIRSAGSGFSQSWDLGVFGCRLNASRTTTAILPRSTAFPAPFAGLLGGAGTNNAGDLRMAPVLIGKSQSAGGSDVLVVMGGNAAAGDVPRPIRARGASDEIMRMDNTVGLTQGDLVLVSQAGNANCLIEQVHANPAFADATNNDLLPMGSTYYSAGPSGATLASLSASGTAYLSALGNVNAGNVQFQLFGVGTNRTLFNYDLLRTDGADVSQAMADGVLSMRAMYGIDTTGDGILDSWVAPDATGYDIKTMMTTPAKARQVVAIRVSLVVRSATMEKADVASQIPAQFSDTPGAIAAQTLTGDDRRFRHRVIEFTIPLRNVLLLPNIS